MQDESEISHLRVSIPTSLDHLLSFESDLIDSDSFCLQIFGEVSATYDVTPVVAGAKALAISENKLKILAYQL